MEFFSRPWCFAVGCGFADGFDGFGGDGTFPAVPAFADVVEDAGDLFVVIDLGEREHEAFAIGDAVDGAGLAVEENAGECGDVAVVFKPRALGDGRSEEFVALLHTHAVGAMAGDAEGLVDLLALLRGGAEFGDGGIGFFFVDDGGDERLRGGVEAWALRAAGMGALALR